jgi:hypothetical protein
MADDSVRIRVAMTGADKTARDAKKVARGIDDIGDQAKQASRHVAKLNTANVRTRVNLGPFSTSMRGGALAVGMFANAARAGVPIIFSAAEAVSVLAIGGGAAGAVGLIGLAQGAGVAKLGMGGLTDALGGNETALRSLTPEVRALFFEMQAGQEMLRGSAQDGLLPGLTAGTRSAMKNLPVVNRLVGRTARMLGGLASEGGGMLGSAAWGRDINTVGRSNVKILDDLGHAGLNLADATRHVVVEAGPLTEWLAQNVREGSRFVEVWSRSARASGDMARFFRDARTDMALLGSVGGHTGRGLINLFGAQDVDGTKTLASLDRITLRFENWSKSPALANGLGDALVDQMPKVGGAAVGALATGMAHAAPTAASLFLNAFLEADAWGKLLTVGYLSKKFGVFKLLGGASGLGGGGKGILGLKPVPVFVTNPNGMPGGPGPVSKPGKGGAVRNAANWIWKNGKWVRRTAYAVAAEKTVERLNADLRAERSRVAGMTPEQIREEGAAARRGITPLSGQRPAQRRAVLDSRGFPTGELEIVAAVVTTEGEKIGELSAKVRRRRQASG